MENKSTGYWIVSMTFARSWIFKMYKKICGN